MAMLGAASIRSRIATGPEADEPWRRLGDRVEPGEEDETGVEPIRDRRSARREAAEHERHREPELGHRGILENRWQGGSIVVRWVSAAIVETEKQFRRVQGWRDIEKLVRALVVLEATEEATAERVAWVHRWSRRSEKINSEWDDPPTSASSLFASPDPGTVLLVGAGLAWMAASRQTNQSLVNSSVGTPSRS